MYKSNTQLNHLNYTKLFRICNLFGRIPNCFLVYFITIFVFLNLFNNGVTTVTLIQNDNEFSKENLTSVSSKLNERVLNLYSNNDNNNNTEFDELITRSASTGLRPPEHHEHLSNSDILRSLVSTTELTSSTTSTTSTTTTSTTSTTTKATSIAVITDFNLTETSYDNVLRTIKVGYQLKANFSLNNQVYSPPILVDIKINCTSPDSPDQFWYRSIKGQLVVNSLTYSTTRMSPYNQDFIPGAYIVCVSTTIDLNQFKTFYSSNYLISNPLPIQNIESICLNETSIQLQWSNPLPSASFFNIIEIKCNILNDSASIDLTIHSNTTTKYVVSSLTPGTEYVCFVTLSKHVNGLVFRSQSKSVVQTTKLSQAVLVHREITSNDLIKIKFKPPEGNYDHFKIQLVRLNSDGNISDPLIIRTKVFKNTLYLAKTLPLTTEQENTIVFDNSLNENSSWEKIQPGYIYEFWTETAPLNTSNTTAGNLMKRARLPGDPFIIKPAQITNLIVYALAERAINVTWQNPISGLYTRFIINVYSLENSPSNLVLINTYQTRKNTFVISSLNNFNDLLISVVTCAKLNQDCDTKSNAINRTFSFQTKKIHSLNVKNYNSGQFLATLSASISLNWVLNLTEEESCDLSRFHLTYTDFNKASSSDCFTKPIKLFSPICSSGLVSNVLFKECDQFDKLNCFLLNGLFNCSFNFNGLNFNTDYNISITALSKSGEHEWPVNGSATIHTETSIPSSIRSYQLLTNTQLSTDYTINIIQPYIDESNGAIDESYLFLVSLGSVDEKYLNNETFIMNKTYNINLIDQNHLNGLLEKPFCSNQSILYEPCLLKSYSSNENDFRQEKPVFIMAKSDGLANINLTGINYENITSNLIKPTSLYQLFYVFKLKNINSKRNILFAINPSEPIRTHAYNQFTVLNQAAFRDGMALWIVIVISIISTLILLLIIAALVTLIVVKYKPKSRFRKAAQIVTSQQLNGHHGCASRTNIKSPIESSSKTTFNNDYTGMFMNDFVEPGEFSRYDMTNIWLVKHANGDLILDEEYRNLPDYRNLKTSYASQSHRNEIKNRFLDIKAYDDSRVILDINTIGGGNCFTVSTSISQKNANDTNSQSSVDKSIISSMSTSTSSNNSHDLDHHLSNDYINANFIQGYSHENKFIATQGPKKETINDFWLMIWQYRVTAIVMLTKLVEKGVERCTQYWPEKLNISEIYGDFEVTMKDQQKCGDYLKRTFELICLAKTTTNNLTSLTMTPGSVKNNNKRPLIVTQYYYPEWPDKDTPSTDPMSILHLIRDVNLNHLKYQYPIVVHCSAGVGRTGTYITLDAMMEKINTENKIDIYGFISKIRERRQYLVQTSKQYVFIHEALYEYCLYGFTDVEASRLVSHYKYLNDLSPTNAMGVAYQNSNKSRLQIEFEKINNAFTPNCQAREAFSSDNKHRNRYLNTICYDENRIKLSALNGSTYINATKVKGYEAYNEVIITQDPMFNTVFEFWKMITEYECNIIVCLNKDFEFDIESIYWPSEEEQVKTFECEDLKFEIKLKSITTEQLTTRRELEITEYKYGRINKVIANHFIYNEIWPEDRTPRNKTGLMDLISQVQKIAAKNERSNITVHAHGGGSNCSIFCALIYLLDQYKNDQHVDVCRLVKKLKTQRPHMIETFEQYQYLYQCLVDFSLSGSYHSRNSLIDCSSDLARLNQIQLNV